MTHGDELPKPPKEAMTAATVRRLVDLYAIAYQRWHSEIGRALDLRALRDSETALSAAIEQLAAEQFEAGRKAAAQECVSICMDERVEPEDGMQDETDESYNMALAHAVGAINARFGKAKP